MDEKQMVSTNALAKQLDAALKATPQFAPKFEAKAAAAGIVPAAVADTTPVESFCAICVKVRPFLNMAISILGPFNPVIAGMAKKFMAVLFGTLIPMICAPK